MKKNRIHSLVRDSKKCWVCNYSTLSNKYGYLRCNKCKGFYLIKFSDRDGDRNIIILSNKLDKSICSSYNILVLSNSYKTFNVYITYNTQNDSINIGLDKEFDYYSFKKLNLKYYVLNIIERHRSNLLFI